MLRFGEDYNVRVLRATVAVFLAAALQLAALGAPLLHAHQHGGHHGRHADAYIHAHVGGHAHADPGAHYDSPPAAEDAPRERVTWLQLFVAVEASAFAIPALPPTRYALPPLLESIDRRQPAVGHSHDPPGVQLTALRGPPVFPS